MPDQPLICNKCEEKVGDINYCETCDSATCDDCGCYCAENEGREFDATEQHENEQDREDPK